VHGRWSVRIPGAVGIATTDSETRTTGFVVGRFSVAGLSAKHRYSFGAQFHGPVLEVAILDGFQRADRRHFELADEVAGCVAHSSTFSSHAAPLGGAAMFMGRNSESTTSQRQATSRSVLYQ
jgi:hypothetical protein